MYRPLTLVLVAAALIVPTAQAKPRPLAGPWYTPKELKALIAYSNNASHNTVGGYSLTAKERAALDTYANASFANKQRILAGEPPVAPQAFPWAAAAAGAAATLGALLLAAALLSRSARARLRRSLVQTTVSDTR
jgi:hypothetical protein